MIRQVQEVERWSGAEVVVAVWPKPAARTQRVAVGAAVEQYRPRLCRTLHTLRPQLRPPRGFRSGDKQAVEVTAYWTW